ncbi:sensor histidine kinase [Leptothoe sp. PORK10 BA2]|uniref:sensor histidine kinase n=1 Tax=Leptothoe sp. PORK10 BA2 TaxID=3110254 RepID=UPI002B1F9275|nr:HAMP domain-containing sensor histidine kinase [Leptothoe sp. PORK10 BA2]MEA5465524.1 HAMP domain-containing sensor histidine kinase [Leptothoe sp. PORK10 BA2]
MVSRQRSGTRRKALFERISIQPEAPSFSYESQIASAMANQSMAVNNLQAEVDEVNRLLQRSPLGYLKVDQENCLLWCNAKAKRLLGIDQTEVYPSPKLLLAIARSYELDQLVEQTRTSQTECKKEWIFRSISTDPANVLERPAYPLRGYGIPLNQGNVGVFLENRQQEVMLTQQRDRWTSDVAHELKTPLTSIRLVGETLRNRIDPDLVTWTDRLLGEVNRLTALVDDMLSLNHLEQQQPQRLEDADVVTLLYQAWQSLEPQAKPQDKVLDYQGPDCAIAAVNAGLVYRMMLNLLDNALKYSPQGQAIHVHMQWVDRETTPGLQLDVFDWGEGFQEKDLPHVFERFYRSDTSRTRSETSAISNGTGLGLSIVQKIVESHQGTVQAKNHPDTGGAWLRVWLPKSLGEEDPEYLIPK